MNHLERLRQVLKKEKIKAFLLSDIHHVQWLSKFTGSYALIFITEKEAHFITDSRYTLQARNEVKHFQIHSFQRPACAEDILEKLFHELRFDTIHFEPSIPYNQWILWSETFSTIKFVPAIDFFASLQMIKTKEEIEKIKAACNLSLDCLKELTEQITVGASEIEVGTWIDFYLRKHGAYPAFETIVASGVHTALPHARPTKNKIKRGDFIMVDFGARLNQYHSDITRTFIAGKANQDQKKIYKAVLESQERAIAAMKPGVLASEVDRIARDVLEKYDLAKYFGHALGHGLGFTVHDPGILKPDSKDILEEGQVWTVEPGVYIEDFGGVRIEDDILIMSDGIKNLTPFPKSLTELG